MGFTHDETVRFSQRSTVKGITFFLTDLVALTVLLACAVCAPNLVLQGICSAFAGIFIGILFVVAHDAAHQSLTPYRWLNGLLGRIAMLPSLHAFSLWQIVHNQTHHRWTNLAPKDYVWTPLSMPEFNDLSPFQQWKYRFYRSVAGPSCYYFFEFWIKRIVLPSRKEVRGKYRVRYIADILLVAVFAIAYLSFLWLGGAAGWFQSEPSSWNAVVFGFVIPFFVWNVQMGLVIYLHHTHPGIVWYNDENTWRVEADQALSAVHVIFPGPFNRLFHWIMEHNAHHARPSIPSYNLPDAQTRLLEQEADPLVMRWGLSTHLDVVRRCKLYDYDQRRWIDFNGNYTSEPSIVDSTIPRPHFDLARDKQSSTAKD